MSADRPTHRILIVANAYPNFRDPWAGIFVRREQQAIERLHGEFELRVVHVDTTATKLRYLTGMLQVAKTAAEYEPDVIHVQYGLSLILAMLCRGPRVVTFHGSDLMVPWQRVVSRLLLRRTDAVIVVARHLAEHLAESQRVSVIPCGVDIEAFSPASREAARERLGLPQSDTVILFPSAKDRAVKNPALFDAVFQRVEQSWGNHCVSLSLEHVSPDEVPDWLRAADVLLLTSFTEGSPVVVREALACGTRVVSVPVGDVARWLTQLSGCRVAESWSDLELSGLVLGALAEASPEATENQVFSLATQAKDVVQVYREVLDARALYGA